LITTALLAPHIDPLSKLRKPHNKLEDIESDSQEVYKHAPTCSKSSIETSNSYWYFDISRLALRLQGL